jgi:hypothetical protein
MIEVNCPLLYRYLNAEISELICRFSFGTFRMCTVCVEPGAHTYVNCNVATTLFLGLLSSHPVLSWGFQVQVASSIQYGSSS